MSSYYEDLFTQPFYEYQQALLTRARAEINAEDKTYLLNINEQEYVEHLTAKYRLEPVNIDVGSVVVYAQNERSRRDYDSMYHEHVERKYMEYELEATYTGDPSLLQYTGSTSRLWSFKASLLPNNKLHFIVEDWNNNTEQVKVDIQRVKDNLSFNLQHLQNDVNAYNSQVAHHIKGCIELRKAELNKQAQSLVDLGIPVIKNDDLPQTFAIPVASTKKRIQLEEVKPSVKTSAKPALPDPTLSQEIYKDILLTIHDVGKVMERLPKSYKDRDENSIRDLFLLYLEPRYTSAGGETFNGQGKTDILIRHENSNVFIAEFKFWQGAKLFQEAIEQLYGYLTWRDSKAAIVVLCRNKDVTALLKEIDELILAHSTFLEKGEVFEDTWRNYTMHFPDDQEKKIALAVQVFHLP